jgi:drug/metabolite transporter (DMT)-like permease
MIYIFVSMLCSVTVGVLFKLASRYNINVQQAIAWNYLVAILLCLGFFKPDVYTLRLPTSPIYYLLGMLLPTIFWILSRSVKEIGIAKTDIAQRLSLVLPLLAAYLIFQERFSAIKITGLVLAFVSVFLMLYNKGKGQGNSSVIFPLLVFLGFGTVDILFKQLATDTSMPYTSILLVVFCIAFPIAMLSAGFQAFQSHQRFKLPNLPYGLLIGILNFSNIFFYLKAHKAFAKQPSVVFASMNIGVVVLGTLIGYYIFHEKLNRLNFFGVALAVLAIIMITVAQYYGS